MARGTDLMLGEENLATAVIVYRARREQSLASLMICNGPMCCAAGRGPDTHHSCSSRALNHRHNSSMIDELRDCVLNNQGNLYMHYHADITEASLGFRFKGFEKWWRKITLY